MIRTKGEPGTGNVAEAIKHLKLVNNQIRWVKSIYESGDQQELIKVARELKVYYELVLETGKLGRLPVVNFAAGGIATPADAALMMNLGCDGVFVGSGVFKSKDPAERARSIVLAVTFHDDPSIVAEAQKMIGENRSMEGLEQLDLRMQDRGTA
jgi:pyridoxal 5'-phosphate synthase pdxS subunit